MADPKAVKAGVKRRKQIMRFIDSYQRKNGFPPSQTEIAEGVGISRTAIRSHLDILADEGQLRRRPGSRRQIVLVMEPR